MIEQLCLFETPSTLPITLEQSNAIMADFFSYEPTLEELKDIGEYMKTEEFAPYRCSAEVEEFYSDGMYARVYTVPAMQLVVGKKHAKGHFTFLIKGKATIVTDEGQQTLEGPMGWVDKPGVQRAIYAYSDATFLTVHKTDLTDVSEIEKELITPEAL